ncbi:MAG: hypothetical protein AB1630_02520 [bacterium]
MIYTEKELNEKLKEEIISLYTRLIETIQEKLIGKIGAKKTNRLFDKIAKELDLLFIKSGKIHLTSLLKDKKREEITSLCNKIPKFPLP